MKIIQRLLLVDDDIIANHLHILLFEDLNIAEEMKVVENGEEALSFLNNFYTNENAPQDTKFTILLDLNMPVMDGFQFLEEFQRNDLLSTKNIDVFVLTSSLNPKDIERAERYNIKGYIPKPLTEDKVNQLVRNNSIF